MHVLMITVEIDKEKTEIRVNNLSREDSNKEEKQIIDAIEELIGEILKSKLQPGDEIQSIK